MYTQSYPPLILRVHEQPHTSGARHLQPFRESSITDTHTSSSLLEIWLMMTHTYIHAYA